MLELGLVDVATEQSPAAPAAPSDSVNTLPTGPDAPADADAAGDDSTQASTHSASGAAAARADVASDGHAALAATSGSTPTNGAGTSEDGSGVSADGSPVLPQKVSEKAAEVLAAASGAATPQTDTARAVSAAKDAQTAEKGEKGAHVSHVTIVVKVADAADEAPGLHVKMRTTTKLKKLMDMCKKTELARHQRQRTHCFSFKGRTIHTTDTPGTLGISHLSVIDVNQCAGCVKQWAAARLLGMVGGLRALASAHAGFVRAKAGFIAHRGVIPLWHAQDDDYCGVVPLLGETSALLAKAQAAFVEACASGEADVAALCLAHIPGIDGDARHSSNCCEHSGYDSDGSSCPPLPDQTVLTQAVLHGDAAVVRVLVEAAAAGQVDVNKPNAEGFTPLLLASATGDAACVRAILLADGVDVNHAEPEDGATALIAACQRGDSNVGIVRALLEANGIDVNRALIAAGDEDGDDSDGSNSNTRSGCERATALTTAASNGSAEIVRALLEVDGVNVNHTHEHDGFTALMLACDAGHAECVRALVTVEGLEVNAATHDEVWGCTALHMAAQDGHLACVQALLTVDTIDVNCVMAESSTPLTLATAHCAAACSPTDRPEGRACVQALVAAKHIYMNHQTSEHANRSALHDACNASLANADLVSLLLVGGSCRFLRDASGASPLDIARGRGDKHVLAAFASGVDYWQRRRHGGHAWVLKRVVATMLLVRQRLIGAPPPTAALVHLPEEVWLLVCAFLRGADFMHDPNPRWGEDFCCSNAERRAQSKPATAGNPCRRCCLGEGALSKRATASNQCHRCYLGEGAEGSTTDTDHDTDSGSATDW